MTQNYKEHLSPADMSDSSMLLILENLANELAREARTSGRGDDVRHEALRAALAKLRSQRTASQSLNKAADRIDAPAPQEARRALEMA